MMPSQNPLAREVDIGYGEHKNGVLLSWMSDPSQSETFAFE